MKVVYTKHCEEKLVLRMIPKAWVVETVKLPDRVARYDNRFIAKRRLNGWSLEVVYVKKKYIKIITCYYIK